MPSEVYAHVVADQHTSCYQGSVARGNEIALSPDLLACHNDLATQDFEHLSSFLSGILAGPRGDSRSLRQTVLLD